MRVLTKIFFIIFIATLFHGKNLHAQGKTKFKKFKKEEKALIAETAFAEGMKLFILNTYPEALAYFEEAGKIGGENAAVCYMIARIYTIRGKEDIALQYASKAVKLDSKNKYYYLLLAEIFERKLNYAEACKTYKKLIIEVPKSEEYYYNLGELYYHQRNYEESIKAFIKAEEVFGKSLPLTQRKQEIYLKMGKAKEAEAEGKALIEAYPDEPDYQVSHAEFLFKNNMSDKAVTLLQDVLKKYPDHARARLLLSDIYQAQGNREKSSEELDTVFNSSETELQTKINIIYGYLKARETEYNKNKALSLSETVIKKHPSEAAAHVIYGEALLKAEKKEEAWKSFINGKNLDNANYNLWLQILSLDMDFNATDSLIKHTEEALEIFPNQAVLWLYNGLGYSMKKSYSKAVENLEEGKKLAGNNKELLKQFNMQLADNYHYTKEYAKSDAAFQEVLNADPDNDHALNNYSYFLSLRKEKLEEAKAMSEKLIKKYPDNPTYLDTYAWVLYMMKNYPEAEKYLKKAVENSENGTILEHYGDVLYQLGKKDLAVEQWIKAKKLGETSDLIDKKIADRKLYE
jgi:tetratricopeptide (TPR) repeat protein